MASILKNVGDINERGYLNGFTRRGYTPAKSLLELIANVLDSMERLPSVRKNPKLVFDVKDDTIRLIDNAAGMNAIEIENMFSLHRENHANEKSRGVSGIGSKPALYILSEQTDVHLYTHSLNSNYFHIYVPWQEIESSGVYTGKIVITEMTHAERDIYVKERAEHGMLEDVEAYGTTISFETNDTLKGLIHNSFESIKGNSLNHPLDRASIVFGSEVIEFVQKKDTGSSILSKYNYFGAPNHNYYTGVSVYTIQQFSKKNEDRFIWVDDTEQREIAKQGKGYSTRVEKVTSNLLGYTHVGDYTVKVGLRTDPAYFDAANPKKPENSSNLYSYESEYLGKDEHDTLAQLFLTRIKLFRNNMLIGLIPTPDVAVGSSRSNYESNLQYMRVQAEISFNPISSQSNPQDRVMGIQENKNQFDGEAVPKNLTRLVKEMRKQKAEEIDDYFTKVIQASRPPVLPPSPQPTPYESEVDSDTESKVEDSESDASTVYSKEPPKPTPRPIRVNHFQFDLSSLENEDYKTVSKLLLEIAEKYNLRT